MTKGSTSMNVSSIVSATALAALVLTACGPAESDPAESDTEPASDSTRSAGASMTVEEAPEDDAAAENADDDEDEGDEVDADYSDPYEHDTEPLSEDHLADGVEMPDCVAERSGSIHVPPDAAYDEDQLASFCPENEVLTECTDEEALAANAGHQPAGWPSEWVEGEPLPDPECHPDFIEIYQWDRFNELHACWEGPETSTLVRTADMTEQDVYHGVWEQSQARADWEVPASDEGEIPEGASEECREIMDEHHVG